MAQRLKTDWTLFATVLAMVAFGLVIIYSASSVVADLKFHDSTHFFLRQAGWAVTAFCALMLIKKQDYRRFKAPTWAFASIGIVLALLVMVYFVDTRTHRWLRLGALSLQPSEFAKPALIVFLAFFVTQRAQAINNKYTLRSASLAMLLMGGMVVIADLGTAVVLVLTAAVVFYVAGLDRRYFLFAAGAAVCCVMLAVAAKPYRLHRIIGYVDPEYKILEKVDPKGWLKSYAQRSLTTRDPSYQARQSKIAVGAGGITGLGLMQGKQKLLYLPEAHTDFIYAVVGEELGLIGTLFLLVCFMVIFWQGLRLYWMAPDDFGRYLALGITASIVIQAFINMSVVLDLMPTKGIPLPMISYGGSSLLSTLICLGMLLSVSEQSG